jgi:hypothetical protein
VQVPEQHGRDAQVVVDDIGLGESGGGVDDAVEVGEPHVAAVDCDLHRSVGQTVGACQQRLESRSRRSRGLEQRALRRRRLLPRLEPDVGRILVLAQPLVGRVAKQPLRGQLGELDLGYEPRLHEPGAARAGRAGERVLVELEWSEERRKPVELALAEARTHLAREAQLAVLVEADEQRPDAIASVALAR